MNPKHTVTSEFLVKSLLTCILMSIQLATLEAGETYRDRESPPKTLSKAADITDRAAGTHNGSNIGLFFENRGKLYPRRLADGPSGEFPINSGHHYIYRINPFVGVAPDAASGRQANVLQGRYTENEEFEAVGGYHNPDFARVAMSDQPNTWPSTGWPVKDTQGNPVVVSSQDSYCVFDDQNNTVETLDIQLAQTGYAFGLAYAEDLLFFTYEITNNSSTTYDSVYFGMYLDFDIGNISGGDPEYLDDVLGFDASNDFVTLRDETDYSAEWGGATGIIGLTLLETPSMGGITDLHYNLAGSDIDDDSLQMVILSSNQDYLPANFLLDDYVHTGTDGNIHIDDVTLIEQGTSSEYVITLSAGPFDLGPNDTLKFITCIVAGVNEADLNNNLLVAQELYALDFETPKPPVTPTLSAVAGSNEVTLYWTNAIEDQADQISGILDFEGYKLYRSVDRGVSWDQIDRNTFPETGANPVPLASFDRINGIGEDLGMSYSYTDASVINGFEYWYSLTAFDQGDTLIYSLESPIGNTTDAVNTISIIPLSSAAASVAASAENIIHSGAGISNYLINVNPLTINQLSDFSYSLFFDYISRSEIGNTGLEALPVILDSSLTMNDHYGVEFVPANKFNLHNLTTGEVIREGYPFREGVAYTLAPGMKIEFQITDPTKTPSPGDYLSLNFSAMLERSDGQDTLVVLPWQKFDESIQLVSDDGLLISMSPREELQDISIPPVLDFDLNFAVDNSAALLDSSYQINIVGSALDASDLRFLIVSVLNSDLSYVLEADTVYDGESLSFNGVSVAFNFDSTNPPPPGTTATFTSVPAHAPNIQDGFQFGIRDSETDLARLKESLSAIRVVPNPYVVGSLWEIEFGELRREPLRQIQFTNLPSECDIFIFTLAGGLIKTLEHNSMTGTEIWDLRAEGGREIAAGIYLYQVKAGTYEYFNRFAVIK